MDTNELIEVNQATKIVFDALLDLTEEQREAVVASIIMQMGMEKVVKIETTPES